MSCPMCGVAHIGLCATFLDNEKKLIDEIAFLISDNDSIGEGYFHGINRKGWLVASDKDKAEYLNVAKQIMELVKREE